MNIPKSVIRSTLFYLSIAFLQVYAGQMLVKAISDEPELKCSAMFGSEMLLSYFDPVDFWLTKEYEQSQALDRAAHAYAYPGPDPDIPHERERVGRACNKEPGFFYERISDSCKRAVRDVFPNKLMCLNYFEGKVDKVYPDHPYG